MAKHSEMRFSTGRTIAEMLPTILKLTPASRCTAWERIARTEAANAVSYIDSGDITELSRRKIYAAGHAMQLLCKVESGKFSPALSTYGLALVKFADTNQYAESLEAAGNAVAAAKAAQ